MKGKVLIVTLMLISLVTVYNTYGDTWTQKADMPTACITMQTGSVIGGKIYLMGGADQSWKLLNKIQVYDTVTDSWSTIDKQFTRSAVIEVVNDKIYLIGGWSGVWYSTVEVYDPTTDTWTKKTDMPRLASAFATCVVDGKIYAIGGNETTNYYKEILVYDPAADTWETKAEIPTPRNGLTACLLGGKIYAIGGWRPNVGCMKVVETYDIATNSWTAKADLPFKIGYHAAFVFNEKILLIGGEASDAGPLYSSVYEYDPETETITEKAEMPAARAYFTSAMVNGKIYVIGGTSNPPNSGMIMEAQVYMYNPDPGGPTVVEISNPTEFSLSQNYPNPFNPSTVIKYSLDRQGLVNLIIYDILGFKVDMLVDANQEPGTYSVRWDADGLASGVYFYRLKQDGGSVLTRKMVIMK